MSAKKKSTSKKKTSPKKAPAKKAPAKKAPAKKKAAAKKKVSPRKAPAASRALSPEERYQRIQFEAYLLAEKNGFAGDATSYWNEAERIVDQQFA